MAGWRSACAIGSAGREATVAPVVVMILRRLAGSVETGLAVRCRLAALRGMAGRRRARTVRHGRPGRGRRACGGAGVACGEVGLAGLWTTTAIAAGVATAVGCVTTGADGTGDGCAEGAGDGAMDGPGVCSAPGFPDERGPGGCRVHGRSGRRRRRTGGARRGRGRGRDGGLRRSGRRRCPGSEPVRTSPYPSATVASTRLTTPRASTRRRRCVPLTWILGSPKATGGRRPAAPSRRW